MGEKGRKGYRLNDPSAQLALNQLKKEIEEGIEEAFKIESMAHIRDIIRESKGGNGDNDSADNLTKN